ncbi:MAG: cupin domain-containing protein [Acidimicrobiales bacterium]|nr:cupin domain-containing protein [Acidimicrobiales bacterium]MDG2218618.1 cupin domain-containing protein [Acidimicrobiales bacterium]
MFVSDAVIEPITLALVPETEFYRLWGSEQRSSFPDNGAEPVAPNTAVFTEDFDVGAALVEMEEKLPGMAAHMEPENPGMHTTASIDYEYVVSGRVVLELDDGATRELGPGDTVIQNGTRHAWRNPYDEPAMMAVVLIAADHSDV